MASSPAPKQWDVWYADLRPGIKGEQTGAHNVLVISSDAVQGQRGVAIVAPITTTGSERPWVIHVSPTDCGIERDSWIECDQLQSLSVSPTRFKKHRGRLDFSKRGEVALAVAEVLRDVFPSFRG